jgi:hypothetical protein
LTLSLAEPYFHRVLDAHPEARTAFTEAYQALLTAKFLKQASPFSTLDGTRLRKLVARLQPKTVPAGATIVRQGEYGEECYMIYRLVVQGWMEGILPEVLAAGLAWVLAAAIVVLATVAVLGELRDAV